MSKFLISLQRLADWFERQKRVLPWRDHPTPYRVWVSEIMLQQTQVVAVIPFFERFMERFPSVEALAAAQQEEVMGLWGGLGYYSRARNLHKAAQQIVSAGRFPQNREEWLEIPGVGPYTAGAILSIAYGKPIPILDGNVERVISRIRQVSRDLGDSHFKSRLWRISEIFVTTAYRHQIGPSVLNQALMELGATICTPKKPNCKICPVRTFCRAFQNNVVESYPPKKKPKTWIQVQEKLHCLMNDSGEVLLRQRVTGEWRAGLWDLLSVKPQELGFQSDSVGQVETRHIVTRHKIKRVTEIWKVSEPESKLSKSSVKKALDGTYRWVSASNTDVPVGSALKRTLNEISKTLK